MVRLLHASLNESPAIERAFSFVPTTQQQRAMIPTTMIEFECSNGSRYSEPVHRRFSVIRQNDDGTSTILFHSDCIDRCWEHKDFHHPNNHSVYIAKRDVVECLVLAN